MKNLVRLLLCLTLSIFAIARAVIPTLHAAAAAPKTSENKPSGERADAKALLADSRKALAAMVKAARADKELDPKVAKNKPFWKSTQTIAKNLNKAQKGLAAKSDDFFQGIADAREAEAQLKIDWQLTDSKNKDVIENGRKLGHALALLRTDFSKEALRKKKGGELTAQEKAKFDKIKEQQKTLLAKLKKLEKEAKKDKALEAGLKKIQAQANHILKEPATVDAYVATLYLLDEQLGLIRGYKYYVDKSWQADYVILVDLTTAYEKNYTEWVTSASYDWAVVNSSVDVYEDVDVSESVSDEEINSEDSYAENESFDMSPAEEEEVAEEEDTDEEVDSDDAADEESMEDESDDEGEDMSDDEGGGDEDMGDDGGDDSGDEGE